MNRFSQRILLLVGSILLAAVTIVGLPYYVLHIGERVRHPLHAWLKPSGHVGQAAGILALALFLFMWLYPLRKRVRWLRFTGTLAAWLDIHIVAGLVLPVVGAVHAAWRFQGLIGLGYLAMLTVSLSGFVGRYLYTHIPRSRSGLELTRSQIQERREEFLDRIATMTGIDRAEIDRSVRVELQSPTRAGIGSTLKGLVTDDIERWRASIKLRRRWKSRLSRPQMKEAIRLVRQEMKLEQQMRMLDATRRVFRFWHVAHMPFAITALVAVSIHVVVVVALGVTWLW